ncbi:MAG: O-antigen ligase family protein [Actinobacteria bacterium]|nr:O-antigen ligase family protein [Actinomycetota bacterium]
MGVRAVSLASGALVVGSVAVVDPGGLAPFGPAKWLVVSTLGLVAAGSALWAASRRLDRPTSVLWTVLLAALGLAALLGGDVPTALLGEPTRHLGFVTWALFALLFCAGQQLDRRDTRVLARAVVVATGALGAWSLWERVVGRPISLDVDTDRLTGPFGSAAIMGAACCLLVPVCVAVAMDRAERRSWRGGAATSAAVGVWVLVESGSRAAGLGAVAAAAGVVVRGRPSRRALGGGAAVLAVALCVAAPRIGELTERASGAASRLDEWRVATRVIGAHPLLGVGPEGYRIAFSDGVDREYEREHSRDTVLPDRAHSAPLDVALAGGVPAALAYVALVALICVRAGRMIGAQRATPAVAGIAAGLIAYATQQLLLFPLAELDPIWWLFAGYIVAAGHDTAPAGAGTVRRWPAAVALACAPVSLGAGVLGVAADRLAERSLTERDLTSAVASAERAVSLRPDDVRYRMVAAEVLARRGTLVDIDEAIRHADRALAWSPDDPIAADRHATVLLDRAAITGEPRDIDRAIDAWQVLVDRDPVRARWQVQLGRAAALAGDAARARSAWRSAADLGSEAGAQLLAELETR